MPNFTPLQILIILANLSENQILQISELLGPNQASINLFNSLTTLTEAKQYFPPSNF